MILERKPEARSCRLLAMARSVCLLLTGNTGGFYREWSYSTCGCLQIPGMDGKKEAVQGLPESWGGMLANRTLCWPWRPSCGNQPPLTGALEAELTGFAEEELVDCRKQRKQDQ